MKFVLDIQLFASKKGVGSTKNGRDSESKRLGAKLADGQYCHAGSIIYRQRGTKIHPGTNVGRGGDDTLFAKVNSTPYWILLFPNPSISTLDFTFSKHPI